MTSEVEYPHPLTAAEPNVDNFLIDFAKDDRIGPPPPAAAAARTVRLRRRRRTLSELIPCGRQYNRGRVPPAVDNFALRELPSLALFL